MGLGVGGGGVPHGLGVAFWDSGLFINYINAANAINF